MEVSLGKRKRGDEAGVGDMDYWVKVAQDSLFLNDKYVFHLPFNTDCELGLTGQYARINVTDLDKMVYQDPSCDSVRWR